MDFSVHFRPGHTLFRSACQGAVQGKIRHGPPGHQAAEPARRHNLARPPGRAGNRHQTGQNAGGQCASSMVSPQKPAQNPVLKLQQSRHAPKSSAARPRVQKQFCQSHPKLLRAVQKRTAPGRTDQPHAEHHLLLPERGGPPGVRTAGRQLFHNFPAREVQSR